VVWLVVCVTAVAVSSLGLRDDISMDEKKLELGGARRDDGVF